MPFVVRRKSTKAAQSKDGIVIDVTSKGPEPFLKLSPFFPHGGIPVPFSPGVYSQSVEGVWQGLKVFETSGIDMTCFQNRTMHGLKRSPRKFGSVLGHQRGVLSDELLDYVTARRLIYLPSYKFVLDGPASPVVADLERLGRDDLVILLDYTTNGTIEDTRTPLSHAALLIHFLSRSSPQ
jgi:hypothetical protein